jgi:hypothetical protein
MSSSDEALKARKARRLLPRTSATVDDVFSFSVVKSSLLLVIVVLARIRSEEEEKEEEYISNNRSLSFLFFFLRFFLGGLCAQMCIHVSDFDDFCHQRERKCES